MAASFTLPTVLANLTAGNQALSLIDGDLTTLRDPLLSLNTYGNYYTDSGSANAYAITVSAPQTVSIAAGLPLQVKITSANTGASTLSINGGANKNILNPNGTALSNGQLPANSIVTVMYDGTQYLMLSCYPLTSLTNSLSGDVALNNTGTYFDGPSVAQGTVGTWFCSGQVVCLDNVGAANIDFKLHDGTTVISSGFLNVGVANTPGTVSLSGLITSPAGNIRISAKDVTSTGGVLKFNNSGNSKDCTLTVIRIA